MKTFNLYIYRGDLKFAFPHILRTRKWEIEHDFLPDKNQQTLSLIKLSKKNVLTFFRRAKSKDLCKLSCILNLHCVLHSSESAHHHASTWTEFCWHWTDITSGNLSGTSHWYSHFAGIFYGVWEKFHKMVVKPTITNTPTTAQLGKVTSHVSEPTKPVFQTLTPWSQQTQLQSP